MNNVQKLLTTALLLSVLPNVSYCSMRNSDEFSQMKNDIIGDVYKEKFYDTLFGSGFEHFWDELGKKTIEEKQNILDDLCKKQIKDYISFDMTTKLITTEEVMKEYEKCIDFLAELNKISDSSVITDDKYYEDQNEYLLQSIIKLVKQYFEAKEEALRARHVFNPDYNDKISKSFRERFGYDNEY